MELKVRRIILFTRKMDAMTAFYRDVIGLKPAGRDEGWIDFDSGACHIALHAGGGVPGKRPPKICFHASDVAAARALLIKRGAIGLGAVHSTARFDMCDGKDPDGNPYSISSRP